MANIPQSDLCHQEHERLWKEVLNMSQSIARIDQNTQNQQRNFDRFSNSIQTSVDNRITNIEKAVNTLVEVEDKIVRMQEQQQHEIEDIKETLKSFIDIREKVAAQEERLKQLEGSQKTVSEIRKEKIKGNATVIVSVVSAIGAIIAAIIAATL